MKTFHWPNWTSRRGQPFGADAFADPYFLYYSMLASDASACGWVQEGVDTFAGDHQPEWNPGVPGGSGGLFHTEPGRFNRLIGIVVDSGSTANIVGDNGSVDNGQRTATADQTPNLVRRERITRVSNIREESQDATRDIELPYRFHRADGSVAGGTLNTPRGGVAPVEHALYGLNQAPSVWYDRISAQSSAAPFSRSQPVPALPVGESPRYWQPPSGELNEAIWAEISARPDGKQTSKSLTENQPSSASSAQSSAGKQTEGSSSSSSSLRAFIFHGRGQDG